MAVQLNKYFDRYYNKIQYEKDTDTPVFTGFPVAFGIR